MNPPRSANNKPDINKNWIIQHSPNGDPQDQPLKEIELEVFNQEINH